MNRRHGKGWGKKLGRTLLSTLMSLGLSVSVLAWSPFVVKDIRLEGLARVSTADVYSALPFSAGDRVDAERLADSLRALFKTGDFEDIQVSRDGDVLVYHFAERPYITKIVLKGNKSIDKDNLLKGLRQAGLAEGKVLERSTLDHVKQELQNQYIAQGRYATEIDVQTVPKTRNRVEIHITIREGSVASIRDIHFVGNAAFSNDVLRHQMQLKIHHFLSFIKSDDKYSSEKLRGDLDRVKSWYLDHGYAAFHITSTEVTLSPDHKQVYIEIDLHEGGVYKVSDVKLVGDLTVPEDQLKPLILVKKNQVFSQSLLTATDDLIAKRIGNDGYVFAQVNAEPTLDDVHKTAAITIYINPQNRVYVRRINIKGNEKTDDEVVRREMRQFESALASNDRVDISKQRLERLGFFKTVKIDKERVPGTNDLIDLNTSVEEQPSGSIGASVGYSQAVGLTLSANVSQNNVFGTGNSISLGITRNQISQSANFSYTNPYFTDDGVSRGYSIYNNKTFDSYLSVTTYWTNSVGGTVNFGYPIDETENIGFSFGLDHTSVQVGNQPALLVLDYIQKEGSSIDSEINTLTWSRSTLNRGVFPTAGATNALSLEMTAPVSSSNYYKLTYSGQTYIPISGDWVLHLRTMLGYGAGIWGTQHLPFYRNFFTGGIGSVRGYLDYTVAPRSPYMMPYVDPVSGQVVADPYPSVIGGNAVVNGTAEVVIPMPFLKDLASSMRTTLFMDAGQAFMTYASPYVVDNPSLSNMRYSVGLGFSWLTPIGPLTFSVAKPLRVQPYDQEQIFQFTIGQGF